jgi:hypothetical protein
MFPDISHGLAQIFDQAVTDALRVCRRATYMGQGDHAAIFRNEHGLDPGGADVIGQETTQILCLSERVEGASQGKLLPFPAGF